MCAITVFKWTLLIVYLFHLWRVESISLLDKSKSYAIFDIWNITTVGKLEFKFKTQSQYCLLLYIDDFSYIDNKNSLREPFVNAKAKHYVEVALIKGELHVTQKILSDQYKKTITLGEELNDLRWHNLRITKFSDGTLQVEVDRIIKVITFPKHIASNFKINSRLYIGGLSGQKQDNADINAILKPRFVGCIENLKYSSGSLIMQPVNSVYKGESIALECSNRCTINPCLNSGKCVNLFTKSRCDCFGTGYEGATCKQATETITLGSSEYITWDLPVTSTSKASPSLGFRIKTIRGEGLVFYSKRHGETFVVELIDSRVRVAYGKSNEVLREKISRHNIFDAEWHTVSIKKRNNQIEIKIDNNIEEYLKLDVHTDNKNTMNDDASALYFGGLEKPKHTYGVKSGTNFQGCLQHVEYNKEDVIYKMKNTINKQIVVYGQLKYSCPYNENNIKLPTTTPVPTTRKPMNLHETINTNNNNNNNNLPIREIHTRDNTIGTGVIVWITAAIVIGTILIMGAAGCAVHQIRRKYKRKTRRAKAKMELALKDSDDDSIDQERMQLKQLRAKKTKSTITVNDDDGNPVKSTESVQQPILPKESVESGV